MARRLHTITSKRGVQVFLSTFPRKRRVRRTPEQVARDKCTDDVHVVQHNLYRDTSIDKLLCRPLDAMRLGIAYGLRRKEFDEDEGERVVKAVQKLFEKHPAVESAINEACHAAMAARKRGSLKRDRV